LSAVNRNDVTAVCGCGSAEFGNAIPLQGTTVAECKFFVRTQGN